MVRTLKVFVERKTFLVRLEGEHGGNRCSITEHSRGYVFVLGFEKDAVGWMIEHLTKAIEMKSHLGFNRKFRGKCCVHLMEVGFNNHRRFIRILEFATNRKSSFLIIPKGEKGRGWENIKSALSSMLVVHPSNAVKKGRQYRGERFSHNHMGPLHWSFAKVVSGEGPRGGGLVPIGRWAQVMVCERNDDSVKWVKVGRAVARSLGKKGVVTIVPISSGKGWGTVTEIDWGTLKLFDLSKARVRIAMKDRSVLSALIEMTDGDWVFRVSVVVVGNEDGGGRRGERVRSTAGGRCRVREDSRMRKEGERGMAMFLSEGTRSKGGQIPSLPNMNSNKTDDGLVGTEEAGGVRAGGDEASAIEGYRAYKRKPSHCLRLVQNMQNEPVFHGKNQANSEEDPKEEASGADFQANRGSSASPLFSRRFPRFRKNCLGKGASSSRNEVALNKFSSNEDKEGFLGRVGSNLRGSTVMILPSTPEINGKGLNFMGNCGLLVAENLEVIPFTPIQSPSSSIPPSCGLTSSFPSPSVPNLPNSTFQSQFPMENRAIFEFFSKKDDKGSVGQSSVGIPNLVMEVIQPTYPYQMIESVNPFLPKPISPNKASNLVTVSQGVTVGSSSGGRADAPQVCETCWNWIGGLSDFNVIRRSSEKLGGSSLTPSMKDFDDFIRECELIDSPLRSAPFTWSNMQEYPVCKRLDRFLYSNEWEQLFPQSLQEVLPIWTSDHWPIVLETNPFKWGPTPFRFENTWLQHPSFKERLGSLDWSPISGESASRLESLFTEEEISKAIFQLNKDKAPRPDGFTIAVFQDCWDVIKEDLVRVFVEFHRSGIIESINASFMVLIPKKSMSKKISDY
ncbi:hypothetical protein CK203_016096 [Vitis vinifera]|uniref:DUF4283 domain-containing protein n=1 Tax=Vitis vinifera TaxID=29760 RepID=A0A438JMX8_VITVI|nr:hypothetical protein CK203_016096 [Vitis vinifera]